MPVSGDNAKDPASRDRNDDSNGPGNGSSMNNNQYSLNAPKYNSQPLPASHTYLPPMSMNIPSITTKPSSIYSLLHQSSPRPESPNPILPPLIGSGSNSHIPSPTPAQPPPPQPPHSATYSMYPSSISLNRSNSCRFPTCLSNQRRP